MEHFTPEEFAEARIKIEELKQKAKREPPANGRVDIGECIISPVSHNGHGYSKIWCGPRTSRKLVYLHRLALALETVPDDWKLEASHICGRTDCFNSSHLCWENRKTNNDRKVQDGTHNRGRKKERVKGKTPASPFVGVSKKGNRWQASCYHNGKSHYLGVYKTDVEAAAAYNIFAESLNMNYRLNTLI